jgi:predicted nucleotidyltransferase
MTIQSTAQIGRIIRDGVVFDVKNWMHNMTDADSLIDAVQDLFALLEEREIDYLLVGGIAILYYVEGRNTQDLDLIMALSSLKALPELTVSSQDAYFVRARYGELQIDLLLTQNPLFRKVQTDYSAVQRFLDREIPLATVEGLLLLKLYALPSLYRQGNFARVGLYENDIATLLHYYQPDIAPLLSELSAYVSDNDFAEIQTIVADIQNRIKRFRN